MIELFLRGLMKMNLDRFSEFKKRNVNHMWKNKTLHIFLNQQVFCILRLVIYIFFQIFSKKKSVLRLTEFIILLFLSHPLNKVLCLVLKSKCTETKLCI